MAKDKTIYTCSECGGTSPRWLGKCPHCNAWNTLVEGVAEGSGELVSFTREALQIVIEGAIALILIVVLSVYMLLYGRQIGDLVRSIVPRGDGTPGDDMLNAVTPALDSVVEVTHSNVHDSLLELSAPGVNKATILAILAERWGIDRADVVAFGDMPNDVELLRWAGLSYAVGDAHPLALEAADRRAPSIADDGVAQVVERLLDAS